MRKFLVLLIVLTAALCFSQDQSKIEAFAHGIARTEGFYLKGSIPNRCNNPGDLKVMYKGGKYEGQTGTCKGGHVKFRNGAAGYSALYHQIDKMLSGESKFYTQEMTLLQVGKLYAKNYRLWAKNLAKNLGVKPNTTLEEYFEMPPRVRILPQGVPTMSTTQTKSLRVLI